MTRKRSKGTGWLTAKTAIATAAGAHLGEPTKISVGWVKKIGEGTHPPETSCDRLRGLLRRIGD